MDTEKKPEEAQPVADAVGDIVISAATLLAHSAAQAVVGRVKRAAKKTKVGKKVEVLAKAAKAPKKTVKKLLKKSKRAVVKKANKKAKKTGPKKKTKNSKKSKKSASKKSKR